MLDERNEGVGTCDSKIWTEENKEWMNEVHYVKRLVRLSNVCTASTISMFCSAVHASLPNNKS